MNIESLVWWNKSRLIRVFKFLFIRRECIFLKLISLQLNPVFQTKQHITTNFSSLDSLSRCSTTFFFLCRRLSSVVLVLFYTRGLFLPYCARFLLRAFGLMCPTGISINTKQKMLSFTSEICFNWCRQLVCLIQLQLFYLFRIIQLILVLVW